MKALIVLLLVGFIFFYMNGGSGVINDTFRLNNESKLEGEWESLTDENSFYTFYKSGRFIQIADEMPVSGTWKISSNTLYLTVDNETTVYTFRFKPGNSIVVFTNIEDTIVLERISEKGLRDLIPFTAQ
jgi:hypothetical protein